MNRIFKLCLFFSLSLILLSCSESSKTAEPLVLPAAESVTSITVISDGRQTSISDEKQIKDFIAYAANSKPTSIQSVQDIPNGGEYIEADINCDDTKTVLCIYTKKNEYFIELPYQGIYKTDKALYDMIK